MATSLDPQAGELPTKPSTIPYIHCTGSPAEIGYTHGSQASSQVHGSIAFYTDFFMTSSGLSWDDAKSMAIKFLPFLKREFPIYVQEMRGVAQGAGVTFEDILALNVRTEIAYGAFKEDGVGDGCTSLSWLDSTTGKSWLAQNWDWREAQAENLVVLDIESDFGLPRIKMVSEAGIIGKIGLNDHGVGVCFNAIRAKGVAYDKLPAHLGLRRILESETRFEAELALREFEIASACTMVAADPSGGAALEWSSQGVQKITTDKKERVFHTNHLLLEQDGIVDTQSPKDTLARYERVQKLADDVEGEVTTSAIQKILSDEDGYPVSICRKHDEGPKGVGCSIFNIVMDLTAKEAVVTLGRLVEPKESFKISFGQEA